MRFLSVWLFVSLFAFGMAHGQGPKQPPVNVQFEVYEMPWKTLEALQNYLSGEADAAKVAYQKLEQLPGVKKVDHISAQMASGERVRLKGIPEALNGSLSQK